MRPLKLSFAVITAFFISITSFSQSFQKQTVALNKSISDICMVTSSVGYAGGVDGIYKTTNGGQTWQILPYFIVTGDYPRDYYPTNFNVVHLHFFNELSGVAYGWHSFNYEIIMTTADGGATWSVKHFAYPESPNYNFNYLNSLHVFDKSTMIIAGNSGRIVKTTDGGDHWTGTRLDTDETDLKKIQFTSPTLGFAAGERKFYTSTDAGDHWSMRKINFEIYDFHFFDNLRGVAISTQRYFFYTNDGGKTWTQGLMQAEGTLTRLNFLNNQIGYASGNTGLIYKTTDGGATWLKIYNDGNDISSSFLLNENDIWFSVQKGYLLYAGDGGVITVPDPTITSISPTAGKIGSTVTINGTNLSSVLGVKFNGIAAKFNVAAGAISTEIPRNAVTGKIELITPNGSVFSASDYVISQEPKLYQPIASTLGTTVVIEGENLQYITDMTYGGFHFDYSISGSQQISFFLPDDFVVYPEPLLTVISPFGTASTRLKLVRKPNVTNIAAATAPGRSFTITGSSLVLASEVRFGSIPVFDFEVISDNEIKCVVPAMTVQQSAPIYVVAPGGTGASAGDITIYPAPEILSVTPTTLKAGEEITITGDNLPLESWVGNLYINGNLAVEQQVRYIDSRTVIAKLPEVPVGNQEVSIEIMNGGGSKTIYKANLHITGRLPYHIDQITPIRGVYRNLTYPTIITGFFPRIDSLTINGVKHPFDPYSRANYVTFTPKQHTTTGFITLYANGEAITYPEEYVITDFASPRFTFSPTTAKVGQKVSLRFSDVRYLESVTVNGQYVPFNLQQITSYGLGLELPITIVDGITSGTIKIKTPDGTFESKDILHILPADKVKPFIHRCEYQGLLSEYYVKLIGDNFATATSVRYDQYEADFIIVDDDTLLVKPPRNATSKNIQSKYIIVESPGGIGSALFQPDFDATQTVVSASPLNAKRRSLITVKLSEKVPYVTYPSYYYFLFGNTYTQRYIKIDETTYLVEVPAEGDVEGKIGIKGGRTSYYSENQFKLSQGEYCTASGAPIPDIFPLKKLMIQGNTIDVPNIGFVDNTNQPIDVIPGQPIRIGATQSQTGVVSKLYVDWNGDKEFNEPGFLIVGEHPPLDTMVYFTLHIPGNVPVGTSTRLRIVTALYSVDQLLPCGVVNGGQIIDYTLNFKAPSSSLKISDFYPAVGTTNTKITIVGDNLDDLQSVTLNDANLEINLVNEYLAEATIPEGATDGILVFNSTSESITIPRKFIIDNTITAPTEQEQNFKYTYRATINGKDVAFYSYTNLWEPYTFVQTVQESYESGTLCLYTPGGELCFAEPLKYPARVDFPEPFEVMPNQTVYLTGINLSQITKIFLDGDENIPFTLISNDSISFIAPHSDSYSRVISIVDPTTSTLEHDIYFLFPEPEYCDQNTGWKEGCELIEVNLKEIANTSGKNTTGGRSDYSDQVAILDRYNNYYLDFKVKNFGSKPEGLTLTAYINLEDSNGDLDFNKATYLGSQHFSKLQPNEEAIVHPYLIIPHDIETNKNINIWFVLSYDAPDEPCGSLIAEIEKYSLFVKENKTGSLQISSMSKTLALASEEIEITGTNFGDVKSLQIGDIQVPFTLISPTTIRFMIPADATTDFIKVTTLQNDAQSPSALKIIQPHTVTSVEPNIGKAGDAILIHGTNLQNVTSITFNGAVVTDYIAFSTQTLRVKVPSAATTGAIHLKNQLDQEVNSETFYVCDGVTVNQYCKADQTITFADLAAVTYGHAPITLAATASSFLPVSYVSSNTNVATIAGNKLTIVGTGTTVITASQPGNSSYNAAPSVQRSLVVNKISQTITFNALSAVTYGQFPFTLTASASSGLPVSFQSSNTAIATITGNQVSIVGTGNVTITALQSGNDFYNAAPGIERVLVVNKAPQTISFNPLAAVTYGQPPITLTASSTSGLPVSFTSSNTAVASVVGSTLTIVGVGSTIITAHQPGNNYFQAAPSVARTLDVGKRSQTITFDVVPDVLSTSLPVNLLATASSGLPVVFASSDAVTLNGNSITAGTPGRVTVQARQAGNSTYEPATPVDRSFCILPTKPTITLNETSPGVYTMTSSSSSNNHWFLDDGEIENENAQSLQVAKSGTYKVNVQIDDCVSEFSETITVTITGIENNTGDVLIYPNPVRAKLLISSTNPFTDVLITSVTGTVLQSIKNRLPDEQLEIDLTEFKAGVYILEVYQGEKLTHRQKIIKE